jgi:hypothetical protein
MNPVCSVRHCGKDAVAEVSFKGAEFQLVCEGDLKRFRAAAQSSGLSLREAAIGKGGQANSPQEVRELRDRVAALEAFVFGNKPAAKEEKKQSKDEHAKAP